jgi:hypothetical protein
MSAPLLVSDRPRPRITKQALNVGCLIYERMDQIDLRDRLKFFYACPIQPSRSLGKKLRLFATYKGFGFRPM